VDTAGEDSRFDGSLKKKTREDRMTRD